MFVLEYQSVWPLLYYGTHQALVRVFFGWETDHGMNNTVFLFILLLGALTVTWMIVLCFLTVKSCLFRRRTFEPPRLVSHRKMWSPLTRRPQGLLEEEASRARQQIHPSGFLPAHDSIVKNVDHLNRDPGQQFHMDSSRVNPSLNSVWNEGFVQDQVDQAETPFRVAPPVPLQPEIEEEGIYHEAE